MLKRGPAPPLLCAHAPLPSPSHTRETTAGSPTRATAVASFRLVATAVGAHGPVRTLREAQAPQARACCLWRDEVGGAE